MKECNVKSPECKYFNTAQCIGTIHHKYWPRRDYKTRIEKQFRELPENKELLSRCAHDIKHLTEPAPQKPTRDEMLQAIAGCAFEGNIEPLNEEQSGVILQIRSRDERIS